MEKIANTVFILFGLTGDLAKRKILPAIYHLERAKLLPPTFYLVGISRKGVSPDDVVDLLLRNAENADEAAMVRASLHKRISTVNMNIDEARDYPILFDHLHALDLTAQVPLTRLFYLAIPSPLFPLVSEQLSLAEKREARGNDASSRYLIEKPFGSDGSSAQHLINLVEASFSPSQIYRIDHYLAKETVQNILAFRFENPLFSKTWNGSHISHILITAAEEIGIEGRSSFYEGMGALRDLIQSHLLQLLALIVMDRPDSMNAQDIHRAKEAILSRIQPPLPQDMEQKTIRAQYEGYREEAGNPDSVVETYAACTLSIESETWKHVPVLIRTGKALNEKVTEIILVYSDDEHTRKKNYLTIRIQPNEGIVIDVRIKKPGFNETFDEVQLDYCYRSRDDVSPEAYERVLYDALRGDQTLFATGAEIMECWRISEPILEAWKDKNFPLYHYQKGSWGPAEADRLASQASIKWFDETHRVCTVRRF